MTLPKHDVSIGQHIANCYGFTYDREYNALLRSTGHRKVDGVWTGSDPFFVYRELEYPGRGPLLNGTYLGTYRQWRPSVGRAFVGNTPLLPPYDVRLPDITDPAFGDYTLELIADGTSSIAALRPGNPLAQVQQFLIELRDLPKLPLAEFERAKFFRSLGNEYLNADFGWAAYIKDMQKLFNLQRKLDAELAKLVHDNRLNIRKSRTIEKKTDSTILTSGNIPYPWGKLGDPSTGGSLLLDSYYSIGPFEPLVFGNNGDGALSYLVTEIKESHKWFVGTFTYDVPDIGSSEWTSRAKLALFGGSITPSVFFEVIPWTWLIDWFADVGSILSNLSSNAVDNEVYTNCNTMWRQSTTQRTIVGIDWEPFSSDSGHDFPGGNVSVSHELIKEYKMRYTASPFGFGLEWPDFSLRQLAILASLGITRGH